MSVPDDANAMLSLRSADFRSGYDLRFAFSQHDIRFESCAGTIGHLVVDRHRCSGCCCTPDANLQSPGTILP